MSIFRLHTKSKKTPTFEVPTSPVEYPDGIAVVTESGKYYLKNGRKYKVRSEAAFKSWSFPVVARSSDAAISEYKPSLRSLGFRDGTVIRDIFNQELYVISAGTRVKITSPEAADRLNLDTSNIPYVSHEDVVFHKFGGSI